MKMNVNFSIFVSAFQNMGMEERFSHRGKEALFYYLIELEDETGEEMELDVIALCCEYYEYSAQELLMQYSHLLNEHEENDEERIETIIDKLVGITEVIEVKGGGYIIRNY